MLKGRISVIRRPYAQSDRPRKSKLMRAIGRNSESAKLRPVFETTMAALEKVTNQLVQRRGFGNGQSVTNQKFGWFQRTYLALI